MNKMKKLPLVLAISQVTFAGAAMAADVEVYGRGNFSVQQNNFEYLGRDQRDNSEMYSNASRLGVKGSVPISDDLKAIVKIEYEVFLDDGSDGVNNSGDELSQRNIVAGLSSKRWGTIQGGKHDTPLKLAADGTDAFNDLTLGDINNYMVGENRENNIVMYVSPEMGGVTFSVATMLGEQAGLDGDVNDSQQEDTGMLDRISAAVKYQPNKNVWVALSTDQNVQNADIIRLNGSWKLGDLTLGGHWQTAESHYDDFDADGRKFDEGDGMTISSSRGIGLALNGANDDYHAGIKEQDAWMVSAKYKFGGNWQARAQYGQSVSTAFRAIDGLNGFDAGSAKEFEAKQMAVGLDYALNKNVTIYGYVAQLKVDVDGATDLVDDAKLHTAGIGMDVKF